MFIHTMKYPGSGLRPALILVLVCGLIWSGSLAWIGNAVVVIPDADPTTFVALEQIDGLDNGEPANHNLCGVNHVPDPLGGLFMFGNGGQDDNRERPFQFRPVSGHTVVTRVTAAASTYHERRTVAAYTDFGHLKVMPAGEAASDSFAFTPLTATPRPPVYYGWSFVF